MEEAKYFQNLNSEKKEVKNKPAHPFAVEHIELKDPEYMNEVPERLRNKDLPGFPSTCCAIGRPGSGKTNTLLNLLTRDIFWFKFFDKIYLLGPTIKTDKLWKKIKVPDNQVVTKPDEFINKLTEWTEEQAKAVEQDPNAAPKCLFVFEDVTAYHSTVQQHPKFIENFTTIRHHKSTAYANIHKLKAFHRTARLACQHIMVWPVTRTEVDQVFEDYGPNKLHKKDFYYLVDDVWKPDSVHKKPFLYINMYAPEEERFRRCFTHIINLDLYEGIHKARNPISGRKDPLAHAKGLKQEKFKKDTKALNDLKGLKADSAQNSRTQRKKDVTSGNL